MSTSNITVSLPRDLKRKGDNTLVIFWDDGHVSEYSAYALRIKCPCARCVDEWTGKPLLNVDKISKDIKPTRIHSIGRYAMGIHFSDGHQSGIYSYDYLRRVEGSGV